MRADEDVFVTLEMDHGALLKGVQFKRVAHRWGRHERCKIGYVARVLNRPNVRLRSLGRRVLLVRHHGECFKDTGTQLSDILIQVEGVGRLVGFRLSSECGCNGILRRVRCLFCIVEICMLWRASCYKLAVIRQRDIFFRMLNFDFSKYFGKRVCS